MTAQHMDARIERRVRPLGRLGRQGAGDQGAAKQRLGLEQAGQGVGRGELRAVEQGQAFLRAEDRWGEAGFGQRLPGRQSPPAEEHLAVADHRRGHMRERRQVTRGADRALGGDDRRQAAFEHRAEQVQRGRTDSRGALGQ